MDFDYIHCDIEPGVTLPEFRRSRACITNGRRAHFMAWCRNLRTVISGLKSVR